MDRESGLGSGGSTMLLAGGSHKASCRNVGLPSRRQFIGRSIVLEHECETARGVVQNSRNRQSLEGIARVVAHGGRTGIRTIVDEQVITVVRVRIGLKSKGHETTETASPGLSGQMVYVKLASRYGFPVPSSELPASTKIPAQVSPVSSPLMKNWASASVLQPKKIKRPASARNRFWFMLMMMCKGGTEWGCFRCTGTSPPRGTVCLVHQDHSMITTSE